MIDHQPRQQQAAGIAAHRMDAAAFPRQRDRACDMIQQAGSPAGFRFVVHPCRYVAREADGAIREATQTVTPHLRNIGAIVEPRVQIGC